MIALSLVLRAYSKDGKLWKKTLENDELKDYQLPAVTKKNCYPQKNTLAFKEKIETFII